MYFIVIKSERCLPTGIFLPTCSTVLETSGVLYTTENTRKNIAYNVLDSWFCVSPRSLDGWKLQPVVSTFQWKWLVLTCTLLLSQKHWTYHGK